MKPPFISATNAGPRPGDALLAQIDAYCSATATNESIIGALLIKHPGFAALLRRRGTLSDKARIAVEKLLGDHPGGLVELTPSVRKTLTEIDALEWERINVGKLANRQHGPAQQDSPSARQLPPPADAKGAGNARRDDQTGSLPCPADPTLPAPTISDQVKAEASGKGQRRALARKISTGLTPLPTEENIADRFRRLAAEVESDEAEALAEAEADERRDRELNRLPSPSAILRRAKRDWPKQCADVQALATELHISLGEAWRRTIAAGVDCMRAGGDGEARA